MERTKNARAARDPLPVVLRAATEMPQRGRYGRDNVFIWALWRRVGRQVGMSLEQFKQWLVERNRAQDLALARADLVDLMDPDLVDKSQIDHLGAQFHFVLDPARLQRGDAGELFDEPQRRPSTTGDPMTKKTRRDSASRAKIEHDVAQIVAQGSLYHPGGDGGGGRRPRRDQATTTTRGSVVLPHARTSPRCVKCGQFHTLAEHRRHARGNGTKTPARSRSKQDAKKPTARRPSPTSPSRRQVGLDEFRSPTTPVPLVRPALAPPPTSRRVGLDEFRSPTTPVPLVPDDASIARMVLDDVRSAPASERFGDKVYVSGIWERVGPHTGMSGDQFKRWLVKANRDGRLVLARADVVGAMDGKKVSQSEIQDRGATFHFVLDPG